MSKATHITQPQLEALIELYFEGETSLAEERTLLHALAHCTYQSQTISEAQFALGYQVARSRHATVPGRSRSWWAPVAVAASLALLLAVGVRVLGTRTAGDECTAWVGGLQVIDERQVMALVQGDLQNMGAYSPDAAALMTTQLATLGEAIELD